MLDSIFRMQHLGMSEIHLHNPNDVLIQKYGNLSQIRRQFFKTFTHYKILEIGTYPLIRFQLTLFLIIELTNLQITIHCIQVQPRIPVPLLIVI